MQTLSGTGALRVGAEFLVNKLGRSILYLSDPTWGMTVLTNLSAVYIKLLCV